MDICVVGAGHVGLVTGACFAELGNRVTVVDINREKIKMLNDCVMPFYEPGLKELVKRGRKKRRLSFTVSVKDGVIKSGVIFIAVGTPPKESGEMDLRFVENASKQIAQAMPSYRLIVEKSTVPVETGEWIKHTIALYRNHRHPADVASNPEFLREGSAINDFMQPDRIVIGVESKKAEKTLVELYTPLNAPILITDIKSAELIKHASNSFLAMKISFINAISQICDRVGADVEKVSEGMGMDKRIGRLFLDAGLGYGGFCFPKDLDAFINICEKLRYDFGILKAVKKVNEEQKTTLLKKIEDALWVISGKTIGVLGLSFKPNTDDMRFAPSIDIINTLRAHGANLKVFDPQAMGSAKEIIGSSVRFCKDPYEVSKQSDCLVVLTEWDEFKELDFSRIKTLLRQPLVIDGRNIYDPAKMKRLGFKYIGMGRGRELH